MKRLKWLQREIREERTIERKVGNTQNVHQLMSGRVKCGKSVQYHSGVKRNKVLKPGMTWMNLESIMLSKRILSQRRQIV